MATRTEARVGARTGAPAPGRLLAGSGEPATQCGPAERDTQDMQALGLQRRDEVMRAGSRAGSPTCLVGQPRCASTGPIAGRRDCVRAAIERARSSLSAMAPTLSIDEAAGAREALAERRSAGAGRPAPPLAQAR